MAIHVALHHKTHYAYDRPVGHGPHVVRLRPAPHCRTRILSYSQRITGGEHFVNWQQDPFANWNARLVFSDKLKELGVEVELVAEMAVHNPFDFFLEPDAEQFPFDYESALNQELDPFQRKCWLTPKFKNYLSALRLDLLGEKTPRSRKSRLAADPPKPPEKKLRTIDFLVAVNQRLWKDIKYGIRLEPGVQTPEETLTKASGSCRDSAWLLCHLFRHCGLAARFVSGYLIQLKPDVKSLDGPSGTEVDFTDLHAWCEVYLPGGGWIGFDPTSGLLAGEGHIPLSCTPEPSSAAPVTGAVDKCESKLHHEMRITRIYESPRVTRPYTDEQWVEIEKLGRAIDSDLVKNDVRLTMGGEPTFISVDDPDGPEWNFTAVSQKKRVLSGELIKRLRAKFAPGSLLHYGQGKWYPGEPLPRYALAAYWRKDGVPIWKDDSLIADESKDYGFGAKEARAFSLRLARTLDVDPKNLIAAYEDAFYYTWKERRFPSNVTPEKSNLKDKLERDRIARIFQKGLNQVVGYTLPIKRVSDGWISGAWFLRDDDTLWLIPGDSPMGLRLPLDSVPWVAEKDFPWNRQQDPSAKLPELPKEFPRQHFLRGGASPSPRPSPSGRGGNVSSAGPEPGAPGIRERGQGDSLSLRETGRGRTRLPTIRTADHRSTNPPPGSSAPRSASSRAMDACTSSCPPSRRRKITSTSSPASNRPPPRWACPSSSKARRRHAIHA
jgi:transglutaminase-like putative cysteine protease